jgi:hypothetical protein
MDMDIKTTTTHTPGPWIVCVNSLDDSLSVEQDGEVITESDPVIVVGCVDDMGDGLSRETGEANARLIAAAPDLLAACDLIDDLVESPEAYPDETITLEVSVADLVAVRNAIRKARGQ